MNWFWTEFSIFAAVTDNFVDIMERDSLAEKAGDILAEEFEVDRALITEDAPLMSTLDLDSLDIVDMVVLVEKHFGVRMAKEDFSRIRTFADLYDMIADRTAL